jgi:gamma-glutamylcyclotransferase (GGCT)/AIG2-like uncharacterized protein YtfP
MWSRYEDEDETPKVHEWKQESWEDRVKAFLQTEDTADRFNWSFPMGVFGTLREGVGNNRLMHRATIAKHRMAFLPHFYAAGLSVGHRKNSTAPFEVFFYTPEEWRKMIYSVDCLESFSPKHAHGRKDHNYYYRTLVWLYLLPEGSKEHDVIIEGKDNSIKLEKSFVERWFPQGYPDLGEDRNMSIAPKDWSLFEKVPCWVYSNMRATTEVVKEENHPVIWPLGR